jgi:hypothetical protein
LGVVLFTIFLGPPAFLLGIRMSAHPWRVALALSWPLVVTSALTTLMGCPISSRREGYPYESEFQSIADRFNLAN